MFKKTSEVKALQRLSGADRKKLRRTIRDKFTQASDAELDTILPSKAEITVARLTNRAYVYTVEGGPPVLFDVDGRGNEIFPTVYALWKVPTLLPAFILKGGEVSRYVLGGADLMFPGIDIPEDGLPPFNAGEPWAIKVPGNAAPIAVGSTFISSSEALKAGLRGKALRVTHYYRDTLWETAEGRHVPNAGFLEDVVVEDPAFLSAVHAPADTYETDAIDTHGRDHNAPSSKEGEILDGENEAGCNEAETLNDTNVGTAGEGAKDLASELEGLKVNDGAVVDGENEAAGSGGLTVEEMDALLDRCLLQALHTTVKEKDLPMPGSTLWSAHILACRPPGSTVDIKKSSHKKLSKWLHTKSSLGLISAKEDKHKKEVMLLGINRGHPIYLAFKPEKKVPPSEAVCTVSSNSDAQQSVAQVEVVEVWKPSSHVTPIFEAVGADLNKFYTAAEASDIVFAYVEKENLVKQSDKAIVVLDAILCDSLYKGTVKRGTSYPTEIHKKDLSLTFLGRMQAHHKVSRGNESVVRKGVLKCVQIMTERRQGNKKVTRVTGMESFLVDADALATELQKKFACSTSVAELPGKKGQNEVLVQGGVLEDLAKHLVQQYGISKKHIEILDKTKK
eukprot:c28459_g1_i1 orf=369-2228(-)